MAQATSGQDLLSLLMRGSVGGLASPSNRPSSSGVKSPNGSGHQTEEAQLPTPITPSKTAAHGQQPQQSKSSGQDALEALFSTLRSSAPPNANISPSAVNHAERQLHHAASPSIGTPAGSRPSQTTAPTSPPLDHQQGRAMLLSMLNLGAGTPNEQEESPREPTPKPTSPVQEKVQEGTHTHEHATKAVPIPITEEIERPDSSAEQAATSYDRQSPQQDTSSSSNSEALEETHVTKAESDNADPQQDASPKQTYVQEASPPLPSEHQPHEAEQSSVFNASNEDQANAPDEPFPSPPLPTAVQPEAISHQSEKAPEARAAEDYQSTPVHELHIGVQNSARVTDDEILDRLPISRFTSTPEYCKGKQIAVNGLIAYGTRAGRVRIIDPETGARLIKKVHGGLVSDMDMSGSLTLPGYTQKVRRLATCFRNTLTVWQIPSSFSTDDAANEIICEVILDSDASINMVKFSPSNPEHVLFTLLSSSAAYIIDLAVIPDTRAGALRLTSSSLKAMQVLDLAAPLSTAGWAPDGRGVIAVTRDGFAQLQDLGSSDPITFQLGSVDTRLGAPHNIELLAPGNMLEPSALLVSYNRGTVLELYSLQDTSRPSSRLIVDLSSPNFGDAHGEPFASFCRIDGFDALAVAMSSSNAITIVKLNLPVPVLLQARRTALVGQPQFLDSKVVATPHHILQMVVAKLNPWPSIFYLHPEGFEQLTLAPSVFDISASSPVSPQITGQEFEEQVTRQKHEDLPAQEPAKSEAPSAYEVSPLESMPQTRVSPMEHIDRSINGSVSARSSSAPSGESLLAAMQQHLAEQNVIFAQMLATQQQMQEARYQQLSRDISTLRSQQDDPFQRVSQAIRGEIRESLLPVIAAALAEIGQTQAIESTVPSSHAEQLVERCLEKVEHLLSGFSQNIGTTISEALSGSIDRYLARLTVNQAEQGDVLEQIREILLTEQMKREEANSNFESQLQTLATQIDAVARKKDSRAAKSQSSEPTVTVGHGHAVNGSQLNENEASVPQDASTDQRPQTPSESYEDIFLHALRTEADPLAVLVDLAPPGRLDRVLPYDGQPLITAPNLLSLCSRLAKDFDNGLETLDDNGRRRLAWILSCLRASKWARANPQYAAYLPRVFTQVMHGLNARKKRLSNPDDVKLVERVLGAVDESSGLY